MTCSQNIFADVASQREDRAFEKESRGAHHWKGNKNEGIRHALFQGNLQGFSESLKE